MISASNAISEEVANDNGVAPARERRYRRYGRRVEAHMEGGSGRRALGIHRFGTVATE
jgi:hypothetical protein